LVGEEAVDLFRHSAIETAEPRLDVRDRHPELDGRQSASDCAVDVAEYDGRRRTPREKVGFVAL
jgi:hypothetical protein